MLLDSQHGRDYQRRLVSPGMVIPLRDDNPTRAKPVLTIAIIAACIYIFAAVQPKQTRRGDRVPGPARRHPLRGGPRRADLEQPVPPVRRAAGDPRAARLRGGVPRQERVPGRRRVDVPARLVAPRARQHAVPVGLRQQHRGPARPGRLRRLLPGVGRGRRRWPTSPPRPTRPSRWSGRRGPSPA